ncbi:MAG: hypothetical protein FWE25_08250 [Lachnospiraceae bacterium]|nr:hypothetical protein [Lachnospiraceae bacterium]
MTERMISRRIRKLKELGAQKAMLDSQIDSLKCEIKADMVSKGLEEQQAGNHIIRLTSDLHR